MTSRKKKYPRKGSTVQFEADGVTYTGVVGKKTGRGGPCPSADIEQLSPLYPLRGFEYDCLNVALASLRPKQ